jgi:hypothetical protein
VSTSAEEQAFEVQRLRTAIARLRASIVAVVFGLTAGGGLMVATAWLVIRGGEEVGPHLGLLRHYLPGYSVTWPGAMLGLIYGTLIGAIVGFAVAWVYNRIADGRQAGGG